MQKIIILQVFVIISLAAFAQVKVYEGTEVIPTYKIGKEEVSPLFSTGRSVQGAQVLCEQLASCACAQ